MVLWRLPGGSPDPSARGDDVAPTPEVVGLLGTDILGSGYDLDLVIHAGAGAYI